MSGACFPSPLVGEGAPAGAGEEMPGHDPALFRAQSPPPHPAFGHLGLTRSASGAKGRTAVLRKKHRPSFTVMGWDMK
ncbi:hypothetical protein AGMMS50256_34290 [Betaproteobacteria bacterium]|nr:hypothetical protein AGMMS50256_34290 [Betaproteobacteria bacterium]